MISGNGICRAANDHSLFHIRYTCIIKNKGAILGDMIGAPYEFDRGNKTKDFPLFGRGTEFTDDSVMTIAVAEALMGLDKDVDEDAVHHAVSKSMRIWGRKYPDAGYGGRFRDWLFTHWKPQPYNSWGTDPR